MKEQKNKQTLQSALIMFTILLIVDQVSKTIVIATNANLVILKDILKIQLVFNNGVAFGIGQEENIGMFIISNLIVLGIIIRFICLQKDRMDAVTMFGLFGVLAGGIGNFIDRVFRGKVVDFINIFPKANFPIFNLADTYIVVGWVLLAFVFAMYTYKEIMDRKKDKE